MRLSHPARVLWIKRKSPVASGRRCLSDGPTSQPSLQKTAEEMLLRPPKFIYDYLAPTSSHLLSAALADHIPASNQPPHYRINAAMPSTAGGLSLPQGHHLVYYPFQLPASRLARDGADLDHAPGQPFVRRMWAGGSIRFKNPQQLALQPKLDGNRAVCLETIENVTAKNENTFGEEKLFVDVWRRYHHDLGSEQPSAADVKARAQIEERRTLVFMRSEETSGSAAKPKGTDARAMTARKAVDSSFTLTPDPFLLFHFSALTYNAHFIHYERLWTQAHEGYKDLLVHGPLSLTLLFTVLRPLLASQGSGDGRQALVESLEYRNLAPLYCGEKMTVCASKLGQADEDGRQRWNVWVEGPDGRLAVLGKAESVPTTD